MRPMPFCPSLEPCANETPVQREDEDAADPPRRRLLAVGRLVQLGLLHECAQQQQQHRGADESHERRQQQRVADLQRLAPIHAAGAVTAVHQRVGDTYADDGADQRVRRRRRKAQPPRAEVPEDRRDQQRKHHGEARARSDLEDEFNRKQRDDAEGDGAARQQHADEVEEARPRHRDLRRQRMRVDDGRHRVGRVMEAVHELEAQRDEQRHAEEDVGQQARRHRAGCTDLAEQAVRGKEEPPGEQRQERDDRRY